MAKLNQIIAIEKSVKSETTRRVTDLHRESQKAELMTGMSRTYVPRNDEDFVYPGETKNVQVTTSKSLADLKGSLARLLDVTLTKDDANQRARADVVVDGSVVLPDVPVTYLLFLEKQLTDVRTFVAKLPTLDPAENWSFSDAVGHFIGEPAKTAKTKKVPRNHVKAEATDKHPAQVEMYTEDIPEGTWTRVNFSGAMPVTRKSEILDRITALQEAVKFAREQANETEVTDQHATEPVFDFILGS